MDEQVIATFEKSLQRCNEDPAFLDLFYEKFLASSPKIREKFARTDFVHQKRALRTSFYLILLAAEDEQKAPAKYLQEIAITHSKKHMDVGAELYDLWLDSLLETVRQIDPGYDTKVEQAWERVMGVGIRYLLDNYNRP